MYALFPNEARDYLQRHQEGAEKAVFMTGLEIDTAREDDSVNVNQIRELVKLIEESDVTEIVVEEGDARIIVRRGTVTSEVAPAPVAQATSSAGAMPASPESPQVTEAPGSVGENPPSWKPVVAPMVGTFYASSSPGAGPFVSVGDTVAEGQTLCILEAMKLMNEIAAEEAGIIREVAVANGAAVEYGTVLFYYEPVA
jgi:oxaloacetate decarboxylase (Na+ extruding) subunit alpha